jgi:uncharacterized MnhB-related membrane protein
MGNLIVRILLIEYIVVSVIYLLQRDYMKSLYWAGVFVVTIAVYFMK